MKISRSSILLLLLTTTSSSFGQVEEYPCFALKGSETCSAYGDYYISLVGNVKRYPFLSNVTDTSSFDTAMRQYVTSPASYLNQLGCTNKALTTPNIPYARYSLTYLCASLIQDNLYSLPCNYQNNLSPPPLCQSTCFNYTSSVATLTGNRETCPNLAEQESAFLNLNSTCQYWSGLNGTLNCVLGIANEPDNCGFGDDKKRACEYCKLNSSDSCCQTMSGCQSMLSVGAIIGIIIGCLVFAAIVGGLVYFYYFKNKRTKNGVSYTNNGFIMKTKVETHHDNTSGLGYESLASQNALVPHPPPPQPQPQSLSVQVPQQPPPLALPMNQTLEEFYEVRHAYPPQMGDELGLHVGDIVCVAMNFDDGWALGFNVTTGLKGVFPIVCVTPAPEELLEQLLYTNDQPTNKTLVEDGSLEHLNMQQICENLRRSMSSASIRRNINTLPTSEMTQHSNIPRRTASIMRNNYDYRESDSPTSPTLHTPFFDQSILHNQTNNSNNNTLSQPEPALFQPIETYEMYRKNNRVSKLEE